jgi:predicted O-methyltransferase YrrM
VFSWNKSKSPAEALQIWMDPIEQSQLLAVVVALAPRRVLEWGSGQSTQFMLDRAPTLERLVTIEHDREAYEKSANSFTDPRVSIHHVAPDQGPPAGKRTDAKVIAWNQKAEFDASLLKSYAEKPSALSEGPFDLVMVDGRARRFCIPLGYSLLRPGGVLVVHDAQRVEYREVLRGLGHATFLDPWKQGQVCVVRKDAAD